MKSRVLFGVGMACAAVTSLTACSDSSSPSVDPNGVAYSFALIGCNRVDKGDTTGNPSTANVEQLKRTFSDIAGLPRQPEFLFFMGDLTLGYTPDTTVLASQLNAWRQLYEAAPISKTKIELVAIPGNHEVQNDKKIAYAAAERTWLRVMAPYVTRGGNGPAAGGADNLTTDQSKLTYSFNYKDAHFVTLNTDPVGNDWHVPTKWVASDLAAARTAGAKHIFLFGHKPAYAYPTVATDGLSQDPTALQQFWSAVEANHSEAMFSAHNHVYYRAQPNPGGSWQIIAGNGGSKLETTIDPTLATSGAYYGFTLVTVLNSGKVITRSYGRDIPAAGYTAPVSAAPTTVRDSAEITWAAR